MRRRYSAWLVASSRCQVSEVASRASSLSSVSRAMQAVELPGDPVALLEQLAGRQQSAFLGEQQEHDRASSP